MTSKKREDQKIRRERQRKLIISKSSQRLFLGADGLLGFFSYMCSVKWGHGHRAFQARYRTRVLGGEREPQRSNTGISELFGKYCTNRDCLNLLDEVWEGGELRNYRTILWGRKRGCRG